MATAISPWSRTTHPDTGEVEYYTEASDLGLKPGESPRTLVVDNRVVAGFKPVTSGEELACWTVTIGNNTYTIFND
jgi:hypothetical protein